MNEPSKSPRARHHQSRLLTQVEVAEMIRKSTAWLAKMRWAGGGIPYRKLGRNVRYYEHEVLEWLADHPKRTSTSE
jgi:predicted DNA-binding transcriptional regulator AlpA